jgi:hypothetical protein
MTLSISLFLVMILFLSFFIGKCIVDDEDE